MKKLPIILFLALAALLIAPACSSGDSTSLWDAYSTWREKNATWLAEQSARTNSDGTPYYKTLVPSWNPSAVVLIHYFNDRTLTEGNLSPMYTSTVDTRYYAEYCEGTALDSSYNQTAYGPGVFRTQLNSVIEGWAIACMDMRVGDTAEVVIPYQQAYGASSSTSVPPYSNLKFNIRLVDIYAYEVNPK